MGFIINKEHPCRCGFEGAGIHLCHRCGKVEGKLRYYANYPPSSLAGMQMKLGVTESYGCDACWEQFSALLKQRMEADAGRVAARRDEAEKQKAEAKAERRAEKSGWSLD